MSNAAGRPAETLSGALSRRFLPGLPVLLMALAGCTPQKDRPAQRTDDSRGFSFFRPVEKEPSAPSLRDVWPPRAIWVVRQKYHSPEEIAEVMDNCCQAGFNTVLFQVRGEAVAYYLSRIEPSIYEDNGQLPPFDPLAVACREAHRRGMALHAWVNVMPGAKGRQPPADSRHVYNAHPDWFWYDQQGRRQPLADFYVSVNPCLPQVRAYLVDVMREIVTRYPVDGLHLDYIRFPLDECPKGVDYPYDKATLALYRKAMGKRPQDDAAAWSRWRTEQVTQLVREVRAMVKQARPSAVLTAAVGADVDEYRRHYFQDGAAWLRGNLVDLVFVMNYQAQTATFQKRQAAWLKAAGQKWVAAGIGEYMHREDRVTIDQLKLARQWGRGLGIFSYNSLFRGDAASRRRLDAIRPLIRQPAAATQ